MNLVVPASTVVRTCPAGSGVYYFLSFYSLQHRQLLSQLVLESGGCQFLGHFPTAVGVLSSQTVGKVVGLIGMWRSYPKLYRSFYANLAAAATLPNLRP